MGGRDARGERRVGGGAPAGTGGGARLNSRYGDLFRAHWGAAVAATTRLVGDLEVAEDAVQDACVVALDRWPSAGVPANPRAWLVGVARHKALDRLRRDSRRVEKETAAVRDSGGAPPEEGTIPDDELALIFLCCHPSLDPGVRVALTLRSVCGLGTAEIAAAYLAPRLDAVLRVVYLVFTEGHRASGGPSLVRGELCDTAVRLARVLARLMPGEPEVIGLLALLLLTDARRDARTDDGGSLVLLEDQDRSRWNTEMISEGEALVEHALRMRRPGPYQVHAAIAACHSAAPVTDCAALCLEPPPAERAYLERRLRERS